MPSPDTLQSIARPCWVGDAARRTTLSAPAMRVAASRPECRQYLLRKVTPIGARVVSWRYGAAWNPCRRTRRTCNP